MLATERFIQVTIWPPFSPHFANRCLLSSPRTAFEPENTQIKRRRRVKRQGGWTFTVPAKIFIAQREGKNRFHGTDKVADTHQESQSVSKCFLSPLLSFSRRWVSRCGPNVSRKWNLPSREKRTMKGHRVPGLITVISGPPPSLSVSSGWPRNALAAASRSLSLSGKIIVGYYDVFCAF